MRICELNITAKFQIHSPNLCEKCVTHDAPSSDCYDTEGFKSLAPEEKEKCRNAKRYQVGMVQFMNNSNRKGVIWLVQGKLYKLLLSLLGMPHDINKQHKET